MRSIKNTAALSVLLLMTGLMGSLVHPAWSGNRGYAVISADQLSEMMKHKDFILINVHVPYEGEIPGTDLFIPYDAIDQNKEKLPRQKDTRIVIYCRTGRMADIAAEKLVQIGYTRVFDFRGSMREWEKTGRPIQFRPR